jgi:hypothetical protein
MLALLQRNKMISILVNVLLLYLNIIVTFSIIYLLLDIFQLGPIVNPFSLTNESLHFSEKIWNSLYFSLKALFWESYPDMIPLGWARVVAFIEGAFGFVMPIFILLRFFLFQKLTQEPRRSFYFTLIIKSFFVTLGALFVSLSLEIFLVPNKIIDGGIVGISIMMSYLTGLKLELFLLLLNIPFLYIGYKKIGKSFVITTLLGISILSLGTLLLYNVPVPTHNPIIASLLGGLFLGVGVGLVIRHGGSLDGTEILGILLNRRTRFSVGNIVMFLNVFIFTSAGLIFGLDRALYSLLAYYIASKMIDITLIKVQP